MRFVQYADLPEAGGAEPKIAVDAAVSAWWSSAPPGWKADGPGREPVSRGQPSPRPVSAVDASEKSVSVRSFALIPIRAPAGVRSG